MFMSHLQVSQHEPSEVGTILSSPVRRQPLVTLRAELVLGACIPAGLPRCLTLSGSLLGAGS